MRIFADYKCNKCDYVEEKFEEKRGDSWPIFDCPKCEGNMYKTFSPVASVLDDSFPGAKIKREK